MTPWTQKSALIQSKTSLGKVRKTGTLKDSVGDLEPVPLLLVDLVVRLDALQDHHVLADAHGEDEDQTPHALAEGVQRPRRRRRQLHVELVDELRLHEVKPPPVALLQPEARVAVDIREHHPETRHPLARRARPTDAEQRRLGAAAGATDVRGRDPVVAVVTQQSLEAAVVHERDVAVLAALDLVAVEAQDLRRESTAVEEEDRLTSRRERLLERAQERRREQ